jgi:hypothetical protein
MLRTGLRCVYRGKKDKGRTTECTAAFTVKRNLEMAYNSGYNLGEHNNISCGLMNFFTASFVNIAVK